MVFLQLIHEGAHIQENESLEHNCPLNYMLRYGSETTLELL